VSGASSRRRDRAPRSHEDRGAALILAVCFVVMVGTISGGLAALVTSSLSNRTTLETIRNREYAADGAVEYAIAQVRLASDPAPADKHPPLPALTACNQPGGSVVPNGLASGMPVLNGFPMRVEWDDVCGAVRGADGTVVVQRNVLFSACLVTAPVCRGSNAVIVRALVNFEQGPTGGVSATFVQTWSVAG
jgi:hypothetical protein